MSVVTRGSLAGRPAVFFRIGRLQITRVRVASGMPDGYLWSLHFSILPKRTA